MAELPRLLYCTFDVVPSPSGMSRRLSEYLAAVEDRYQAVVLSVKTPDHSHIEKYRGARLLRVPVGSGDLAARVQAFDRAVRRQLESEEYALAHFTDPFGGYALCESRGDHGHKLVYEAEAFPSQELRHTHPQLASDRKFVNKIRRQELFCLMNAEQIVTGSTFTKNFIHSLGVPAENVRVLRPPVDLTPYRPEILGQPDGKPLRALYLGNSNSWQGLETLLSAAKIAAKDADVVVTIVGPRTPEQQAALEEKIAELGLEERVELQYGTPLDDVFKVVAASDLGLLPLEPVDRNNVQGGALAKVADYLAAGRPVLAADLEIAREVVPESAGSFFEPGDPVSLAAELVKLAKDPARRVRMGKAARAAAEERHDATKIRRQLLDLYSELSGGGIRPEAKASSNEAANSPTVIGTGVKKPDGRRKKKSGEPKTDPAIKKGRDEPGTDPNRVEAAQPVVMGVPVREPTEERTDRAEPVLGKPPASVTPDSFIGPEPISPFLTGGAGGKESLPKLPPPPPRDAPVIAAGSRAGAETTSRSESAARPADAPVVAAGSRAAAEATSRSESAARPADAPVVAAGSRAAAETTSRSESAARVADAPVVSAGSRAAAETTSRSESAARSPDASSSAPARAPSPSDTTPPAGPSPSADAAIARSTSPSGDAAVADSAASPRKRPLIGGGKKTSVADEPAEISADDVVEADEPEDASDLAEPADDDVPEHVSDDEISEVEDEELPSPPPPALTPKPFPPLGVVPPPPPASTPRPAPSL
ncbi:MAG: glycosyltransferase, partial [Myxococcaceae bacterium]